MLGREGPRVRTSPTEGPLAAPGGHTGCTPSLTIFSAAVLLMKRDPCPGLPTHFTLIPAAAGGEAGAEQNPPGPSRARDGAAGTRLLTPRALLPVEDAEGVRRAGQACSGHRQEGQGGTGVPSCVPLCSAPAAFPTQAGSLWVTAPGKKSPGGPRKPRRVPVPAG